MIYLAQAGTDHSVVEAKSSRAEVEEQEASDSVSRPKVLLYSCSGSSSCQISYRQS